MAKFQQTTTITYHQLNIKGYLSQQALLALLQDTAIAHSDSLGYTLSYLEEEKRGWALTNWHILVKRWPVCGETVTISTWATQCRRLQAERSFEVVNETGEVLVQAASRWIFMDLERRRPCPIPKEMEAAYASGEPPVLENEKFRMPKETQTIPPSQNVAFRVRRSETDTNGHVNNTQYVAWAADLVSDDVFLGWVPKEISVVYRKEAYRHQLVCAKVYEQQAAEESRVLTRLLDETEETVLADVLSVWKKENGQ